LLIILGAIILFLAVYFITKGIRSGFLTTPIGELRERKAGLLKAYQEPKDKKRFFFKWQIITLRILFIVTFLVGLTVSLAVNDKTYIVAVVLDALGILITPLIAFTIGNAIYYNAQKKKKPKSKSIEIGIADEISKFKELLDDGAITQEEYDKKKKELLG
jgi:hypothetical protein